MAGSDLLPANTWSHIAATYDGATLRVFRNGVLIGSRAMTGGMPNSSNPLKFGGNSVWSEWFKVTIDEVRVWNAPRTAAEILADSKLPV